MNKLSLLRTTIGIIGSQSHELPRLIIEAHRFGIKVDVYTDHLNSLMQNADFKTVGQLNDHEKLKQFAEHCQLVVYLDGDIVNKSLINYLKQFTEVPQGSDVLDITKDRSIQHVFLNMTQVKSLSYQTVFDPSDIKRSLKPDDSLLIEPVQSNDRSHTAIIDSWDQVGALADWFNGEAYLVEALPRGSRYFDLTVVKSSQGTETLPVVEKHYQGNQLISANLSSKVALNVKDKFNQVALRISNHLNHIGALTISFVLTSDDKLFVSEISFPFNIVNNIFNLTLDNLYRLFLRSVLNLPVQLKMIHKKWLIKLVNRNNGSQLQAALDDNSKFLNLSSLINKGGSVGYLLAKK